MSRLRPHRLGPCMGGVNKDFGEHLLRPDTASRMDNFVQRKRGAITAAGWAKLTDQILTDNAASPTTSQVLRLDEYFRNDGTSAFLAFTNYRGYYYDETTSGLWLPFTPITFATTFVDVDSAAAQPVLSVDDTTIFAVNQRVIINEGGAREEEGVISSISVGVSITLKTNLAFTHTSVQADIVQRTNHRARVDLDSAADQVVLSIDDTTAFTVGQEVLVGNGTARAEYVVIDVINAGVSIEVSRPSWAPAGTGLQFAHTAVQADTVHRPDELTYGAAVHVDSTLTGDVFYFTNFTDRVQKLTSTTIPFFSSDVAGLLSGDSVEGIGTLTSDLKARYVRAFENFLILGNLQEEGTAIPQKIRWCQFGNFAKWVNEADTTGQAGAFLFDGADFIQGIFQLKRELLIYRERSIEAMSHIGLPDIFGFRRAETGTGLYAPNAIVDLGDTHIFVGPDNVWEYNGISLVAIGDAIKEDFFDRLDPSVRATVKLFFLEETDEIWLSYSTTASNVNDEAYVYNIALRTWSGPRVVDATGYGYFTEIANTTWDTASGTWDGQGSVIWDSRAFKANAPLNMMGNDDGLVFTLEQGDTADGSTITGRYETQLSDLTDATVLKRAQRVRCSFGQNSSVSASIYIGTATDIGDQITWHGPFTLNLTADQLYYAFFDVTGRYFKVRVEVTTIATLYDIHIDFMPRGYR